MLDETCVRQKENALLQRKSQHVRTQQTNARVHAETKKKSSLYIVIL